MESTGERWVGIKRIFTIADVLSDEQQLQEELKQAILEVERLKGLARQKGLEETGYFSLYLICAFMFSSRTVASSDEEDEEDVKVARRGLSLL